ncbi:MAG: nucleotidyl transferase AbiEii/AbiGii toxin family protein [Candidatus Bathyarchaeia archaeon]
MEKRIPLQRKMKRETHKRVAMLQDVIVETLYRVFPRSILHGGTAIWRCYSGNRFSEDADAYIERNLEKVERFFGELKKAGFKVLKKGRQKTPFFQRLVLTRPR